MKQQIILSLEYKACYACDHTDSYKNRWYLNEPIGKLCHGCYNNLIANPKRLRFRDKQIVLSFYIRKGVCTECGDSIFHEKKTRRCRRTQIHHIAYFIIFPWFMTVELCDVCHMIQTMKDEKELEDQDNER